MSAPSDQEELLRLREENLRLREERLQEKARPAALNAKPNSLNVGSIALWLIGPLVGIGILILILSGTFSPQNVESSLTPDQQLIAKAEADVRDHMKDPTTAQFSEESANVAGNCVFGKVLGKNGFGAFAGTQGFVWKNGLVKFETDVGFMPYMDARLACIGEKWRRK